MANKHERGLLLVGHGTRDVRGIAEFEALLGQVRERFPGAVEGCFLELAEPGPAEAIGRLVEQGARQLKVLPLLLFAAGHARRDVPSLVAAAAARYPEVCLAQGRHLGCQPHLVELSAARFREALAGRPELPAAETLLLLVGRGSRDRRANSQLARFARLRFEATPVGWLETCYLAMTEPSLARAIEVVAVMPFRRIVVQPHLLFQGELLESLQRQVAEAARRFPTKEWIVTGHLGPDRLLAEAVLARAGVGGER